MLVINTIVTGVYSIDYAKTDVNTLFVLLTVKQTEKEGQWVSYINCTPYYRNTVTGNITKDGEGYKVFLVTSKRKHDGLRYKYHDTILALELDPPEDGTSFEIFKNVWGQKILDNVRADWYYS